SVRLRSSRRPRRLMRAPGWRLAVGSWQRDLRCQLPTANCQPRSRGQIVTFEYPVQDAIDELRRLLRAELLGDLDGLVDDDQLRRVGLVQELVDRHADDVAVDHRHALEAPVVGLGHDHLVDFWEILEGAAEDARGELARVRLRLLQILERVDHRVGRIAGEVVLVEHLQRQLACFASRSHPHRSGLRSARHKFAISIAASAASQPLLPAPGDERAVACSAVLQGMTPKATGNCASTATRDNSLVTCAEMKSKCGVSPRRRHPRAMTASMLPAAMSLRATAGISKAPGTR